MAIPADVRHRAKLPVYLLRSALGEDPAGREYPPPSVMLTPAELEFDNRTLSRIAPNASSPRVGVFANATAERLLAKNWWYGFIDAFLADVPGCRIVEIVPPRGKSMLDDRFPSFYSSDIRKVAAVLADLDAYVSAGCGVMHLA